MDFKNHINSKVKNILYTTVDKFTNIVALLSAWISKII